MTAGQIIDEIEALAPEEQAAVIRFAQGFGGKKRLAPEELSSLASKLAETDDPKQAATLREKIEGGFYRGEGTA